MTARGRTLWAFAGLAAMGLLPALPPSSHAAEDAGTRSVFAHGAGNRALALGGAFVAVADDASAAVWNPAGLGWVARREFQAAHASYELGFAEGYASFVVPSWRWGATALTFRHFGVDGIESRDSRNVLLASDLASSETEIAVAYGRPLGGAWSAGGAVKLQRQSLAGRTGSGLGADLGLAVQPLAALGSRAAWASRWTWGLSLRNAVQPSVRLDQESVAEPATLRTGIAYRSHRLLGALDLEKSADTGSRLHAGLELTAHPLLALRAGFNGSDLTAGAGLRWRDVGFDYAFEDNALASVHRLGVSLPFGPTVLESRQAALRAEEEKLQSRLAEAFQKQEEERVGSLLARAEEARAQARFDEALDVLATIATLKPGDPRAATLETRCLRENAARLEHGGDFTAAALAYGRLLAKTPMDTVAAAAQLRCRAESDRRSARSEEIRQQFATAMDAFASEDLARARQGFAGILRVAPADEDAAAMLRRTEQAAARRAESLIRQAHRAIAGNRLVEAAGLIEQARALDGTADGLSQAVAALGLARQAEQDRAKGEPGDPAAGAAARVTPEPAVAVARPVLTAQRQREVEDLYRRGLAAAQEKRSDDALRYWELVWSAAPSFENVAEYLKREYLMRGMEAFAAGRLDDAVGLWEKALRVDPSDERAKGYLARAQKQLARTREILGASR